MKGSSLGMLFIIPLEGGDAKCEKNARIKLTEYWNTRVSVVFWGGFV